MGNDIERIKIENQHECTLGIKQIDDENNR
jgi:hypothetical protein